MIDIHPLALADPDDLEALLDEAFGQDRRGRTAYRMREGVEPLAALSLAASDGGRLIASLQSWPLALVTHGAAVPLVLVGPVAVSPDRQREGIGRQLMTAMLDAADAQGWPPQLLIGDADYYGRFFGFDAAQTASWEVPGPVDRARLLLRTTAALPSDGRLEPGAWADRVSKVAASG